MDVKYLTSTICIAVLISIFPWYFYPNQECTLTPIAFLVDINQNRSNTHYGTCTLNRINSNQECTIRPINFLTNLQPHDSVDLNDLSMIMELTMGGESAVKS